MKYVYNKYVLNILVLMQLLLKVVRNLVVFELYYLGIYWISVDGSFDFKSMISTYTAFTFILIFSSILKYAFNKDLIGIFRNLLTLTFIGLIFEKSSHVMTGINNDQNVMTYFFEVLAIIGIVSLLFNFVLNKMINNVLLNYYLEHSDDFTLVQRKFVYDVYGNERGDYKYYYMNGFNPFGLTYIDWK